MLNNFAISATCVLFAVTWIAGQFGSFVMTAFNFTF